MTHSTVKVPFPRVHIGEWNAYGTHTAPGMFVYRHMQAQNLIQPEKMEIGDMTVEQWDEFAKSKLYLRRPLGAMSLFLSMVALEDFILDLGYRIAEHTCLERLFPKIAILKVKALAPKKPFSRLDSAPFQSINPEKINALYL